MKSFPIQQRPDLQLRPSLLSTLIEERFPWARWERWIRQHGITIDRAKDSIHPHFPIRYPIAYGYVRDTESSDGEPVDVFVGTLAVGVVGAIITRDHRKHDCEIKLLYNCHPVEVYLAHGFINFDTRLLDGTLILRHPMAELWREADARA